MWASSGTPSTASIRSRSSKSSPTEASKPSTGLDAGVPRRVDRGHRHPARGATDGRRPRGSGHMTRLHDKTTQVVALGATPVLCDTFDVKGLLYAVSTFAPDLVMHQLTDLPDDRDEIPGYAERNNRIRTERTRNLLTAAAAGGAGRFLAQSIAWARSGSGDAVAEHECLVPDAGSVVVRYGQLYGPGTYYADDLPAAAWDPRPRRCQVHHGAPRSNERNPVAQRRRRDQQPRTVNPMDQRACHTARVSHARAREGAVIGHLFTVSLSRVQPYSARRQRRARGATSAPADAPTRETPACGWCGGTMSCIGLRRSG